MRYAFFLFLFLVFVGCRSSDKMTGSTHSAASGHSESENSTERNDSVSLLINEYEDFEMDFDFYRREYFEPAPGDTAPPAVKSEMWGSKGVKKNKQKDISQQANSSIKEDSKSSETEDSKIDDQVIHDSRSDSRLIQGSEWLWVIIGSGVVLTCVLVFIFKKKR